LSRFGPCPCTTHGKTSPKYRGKKGKCRDRERRRGEHQWGKKPRSYLVRNSCVGRRIFAEEQRTGFRRKGHTFVEGVGELREKGGGNYIKKT